MWGVDRIHRLVVPGLILPAPYHAPEIDVGSIRLNNVVRAASDFPGQIAEHDTWLTLRFSREELQRTLTPGEQVPVSVTGMLGGAPFVGTDHITVAAAGRDRFAAGEQAAENRAAAFALRPASPVHGPLLVSFSLASDKPATLAVYDIGGRLVETRSLDAFGPGSHSLRLGGLPAGVYLLRLSQGESRLTSRAVVIR